MGDFRRSSDFMVAVGPALADARPISFAIRRGDVTGYPVEQPEPIEKHTDAVLVRTVGGAPALTLWQYSDIRADVDPNEDAGLEFPADYEAWWAERTGALRLPPLP